MLCTLSYFFCLLLLAIILLPVCKIKLSCLHIVVHSFCKGSCLCLLLASVFMLDQFGAGHVNGRERLPPPPLPTSFPVSKLICQSFVIGIKYSTSRRNKMPRGRFIKYKWLRRFPRKMKEETFRLNFQSSH